MTVFHNLCRNFHEITAPPLDCARSGVAHDLFSRHKREDFITTTQTAVSTILGQVFTQTGLTALPSHQQHLQLLRPQAAPVPSAFAGFTLLQFANPVPSGFHAVVWILDILHGVRARFI